MTHECKPALVSAPFSAEQVQRLNERQCHVEGPLAAPFHPFTCPHRNEPGHSSAGGDLGLLIATEDGWVCPSCDYTQSYTYPGMIAPARSDTAIMGASVTEIEASQRQLVALIDRCRAEYLDLRSKTTLQWDILPEEQRRTTKLWQASATMLGCLNLRRLAALGVERRPGYEPRIDSSWRPCAESRPPAEHPVQALLYAQGIANPSHAGFGSDHWVTVDRRAGDGTVFWTELCQTGSVTHWRELGAAEREALEQEHRAESAAILHIHSQEMPHDEVLIVGNRAGLQALANAVAEALQPEDEATAEGYVFAGDGEGYRVVVHLGRGQDIQESPPPYRGWEEQ